MYRSRYILISVLVVLLFASGCAKKNVSVDEVEPAEPIAANDPVEKSEPVVVQEQAKKDPLADSGFFSLEASALKTVYFDYDSYQLSPEAVMSLDQSAEMLLADPDFKVIVEGHCDARGSDEYNMSLGELRAHAVMNYFSSRGIAQDRMIVVSYGEEQPAVKGNNKAAWAKNRRVEFTR
ncbi:MAG TPA: peptidoglycan-associated lipoprotein Pal [Geopsychrobacteraceae bacterium]|nr:peptidoglycan-associated lipoprotein Pal [Geopsychrobacteraceae bacterium]